MTEWDGYFIHQTTPDPRTVSASIAKQLREIKLNPGTPAGEIGEPPAWDPTYQEALNAMHAEMNEKAKEAAKQIQQFLMGEYEEERADMKFVEIDITTAMQIVANGNLESRLYFLGTQQNADLHNLTNAGQLVDIRDVRDYRWFKQE